jgi:hypothetical protein
MSARARSLSVSGDRSAPCKDPVNPVHWVRLIAAHAASPASPRPQYRRIIRQGRGYDLNQLILEKYLMLPSNLQEKSAASISSLMDFCSNSMKDLRDSMVGLDMDIRFHQTSRKLHGKESNAP